MTSSLISRVKKALDLEKLDWSDPENDGFNAGVEYEHDRTRKLVAALVELCDVAMKHEEIREFPYDEPFELIKAALEEMEKNK